MPRRAAASQRMPTASARAALNMGNEAFVNTGYVWVTKQNLNDEAVQSILN